MRSALVDVGPLRRNGDFRRLFIGQGTSLIGTMITLVAIPFQVYRQTHSSLDVGLLGLAEFAPLLLAALAGGVLADALDRRRLVLVAQSGRLLVAVALVANATLRSPHLWLLYIAAASSAGFSAVMRPSLTAMVPRLVPRADIEAAAALEGLQGTVGMIGGPALGGILIAGVGVRGAYGADVVALALSLLTLRGLHSARSRPEGARVSVRSAVDGLQYVRSRQDLLGTYLVDMNAMFFGMPTALFPALAVRLGGSPGSLGLLYAAPAAGAMVASLGGGWINRVHFHGRAILWSATGWGLAIVAFGIAPSVAVAVVFLAVAGGADMVSGLFRMTMWNHSVPDDIRGRVAAVEIISYTSGPSLGNVEAGAVASVAGIQASIVSGGVLCVLGCGALALALPRFWRYDSRVPVRELTARRSAGLR